MGSESELREQISHEVFFHDIDGHVIESICEIIGEAQEYMEDSDLDWDSDQRDNLIRYVLHDLQASINQYISDIDIEAIIDLIREQ